MNKILLEAIIKSGIILSSGAIAGLASRGAAELVYDKIDIYKDTEGLSEDEYNKVVSKRKKLRKNLSAVAAGVAAASVSGLGSVAIIYTTDKINNSCNDSNFTIGKNNFTI